MKWWHRLIHGRLMHRRIVSLDNYEFTECWCGKAWMPGDEDDVLE